MVHSGMQSPHEESTRIVPGGMSQSRARADWEVRGLGESHGGLRARVLLLVDFEDS